MRRVTLVKLFVNNQGEALEFYTAKLGFEVVEASKLGDYRWLLVRLPDNREFALNLDVANTDEQRALVGCRARTRRSASKRTTACASSRPVGARRRVRTRTGDPAVGTGVLMRGPLREPHLPQSGLDGIASALPRKENDQ